MKEDNNPFQPTLAEPADDSVLATDTAADNFLAGSDQLAQRAGMAIDNVKPVPAIDDIAAPHLDQMTTDTNSRPDQTNGMMLGEPITTPDISNFNGPDAITPTTTALLGDVATKKEKKAKAKKHLFGGKKTDIDPDDSKLPAKDVFEHTNDNSLLHNNESTTLDYAAPLTIATPNDDNNNASPISASLATAAEVADSKSGGVELTSKDQSKKNKNKDGKTGQPKQMTVSVLTIIFFILFLGATAAAVYFGIQNNKNSNELSDAQAKLQQLTDENNSSTTSSNKSSTQFDALQDKIAELTAQSDEKQKTIDENKTTIDNLNKQVSDLNTKLTDTQNKLTSDTQVSDKMQSLITTMCANEPYKSQSSVCIEANGGNAGGQTAGATSQTQPAGQ